MKYSNPFTIFTVIVLIALISCESHPQSAKADASNSIARHFLYEVADRIEIEPNCAVVSEDILRSQERIVNASCAGFDIVYQSNSLRLLSVGDLDAHTKLHFDLQKNQVSDYLPRQDLERFAKRVVTSLFQRELSSQWQPSDLPESNNIDTRTALYKLSFVQTHRSFLVREGNQLSIVLRADTGAFISATWRDLIPISFPQLNISSSEAVEIASSAEFATRGDHEPIQNTDIGYFQIDSADDGKYAPLELCHSIQIESKSGLIIEYLISASNGEIVRSGAYRKS